MAVADFDNDGRLDMIVVGFNLLAILFLYAFRNLYRLVERLMMLLIMPVGRLK